MLRCAEEERVNDLIGNVSAALYLLASATAGLPGGEYLGANSVLVWSDLFPSLHAHHLSLRSPYESLQKHHYTCCSGAGSSVSGRLAMASPWRTQGTVAVKTDSAGSSIDIQVTDSAGVTSENLSLSTWGASFILANQLHKLHIPFLAADPPQRPDEPWMLELGAGTGVVGLAAAAIWKANVVLTDLAGILPGIKANIAINESLLSTRSGRATCGFLDWTTPTGLAIQADATGQSTRVITPDTSKPVIIMAADTIYDEVHPQLLTNTIYTWLSRDSNARAIICYPLRMAYIDHIREFWAQMEAAGLDCIDEGREDANDDWNEVPNTPYEWCVWAWSK